MSHKEAFEEGGKNKDNYLSTHPLVQRLMVLVVCRDGSVESWQALGQPVAGPHGVVPVLQPHPAPLPRDAQVQRASQLKIFRNFTINIL